MMRVLPIVTVLSLWSAPVRAEEAGEAAPEPVKILFFLPSDLAVPAGVGPRITKIADAAEAFFFQGMARQGYPAAAKSLFRRDAGGQVELLEIRGDEPAASGKYGQPNYAGYVVTKALEKYHLVGGNQVWWIFIYLGDRPTRFENWAGTGNPLEGGWAMINYDTVPGDIRPDLQLTEGFNFEYKLKSTIHELAHGFGLPHMGPDPTLGLGNSLMGPNPPMYATRPYPKGDHVYLAASEAAMLWKHPNFSGKAMAKLEPAEVKLTDYKAAFDADADTITVSGKLTSSQPAHSVVLIDDRGDRNPYWSRSYAARLAADGTFQIKIDDPARKNGHYRIVFCFDCGVVSGDGHKIGLDDHGEIRKSYRFHDDEFEFSE